MSKTDPIDLRQDRRQWLKTSAALVGSSLLPVPPLPAETSQTETTPPYHGRQATGKAAEPPSADHFFTPAQHALVEELTETIIPADSHSGGAKAAKVADYIDQLLLETYDDHHRGLWHEGLRLIDVMTHHYSGKSFVEASPEQRISVLKVLSDNDHMTDLPEVRFFVDLKRLTVRAYYTSNIGIHDELGYKGNRILQEYVGCDDQGPSSS
jgi:gluconate 2-dehydrogenase subunit 3-like protein